MHGTGEAGATITLYAQQASTTAGNNTGSNIYIAVATAIVAANGSWSIDVSNISDVPINDNEFFYVTQTDKSGNTSAPSDSVHYWHGDWTNSVTEVNDDYIFAGNINDTATINVNDANDDLVIDGGNGNDTAIFKGNVAEYSITTNSEGHLIVTHNSTSTDSDNNGIGDQVELRNIETIKFADGTYDVVNGTFVPTVSIATTIVTEDNSQIIGTAIDTDGTIALASYSANHGIVSLDNNGNIIYTPNSNYSGSDDVTITIVDDKGATVTKTINLTINAVADSPIANINISTSTVIHITEISSTSQDLGKLSAYLNGQNNILGSTLIDLANNACGNTILTQTNIELSTLGDGDVAMYNAQRDIDSLTLSDSTPITATIPQVDLSGATMIQGNITGTYSMSSDKEVFADNAVQLDIIKGTNGNDTISVGGDLKGSSFYTYDGDDSIVGRYGEYSSGASIYTGNGNDTVVLEGNLHGTSIYMDNASNSGNDIVDLTGQLEASSIYTYGGDDNITVKGDMQASSIYTGDGNDKVIIDGGDMQASSIYTGDGNDIVVVRGNMQASTVVTGSGNDIIALETLQGSTVNGESGTDIIYLAKSSSSYSFEVVTFGHDVNGIGNMSGILVDHDTGDKLFFYNIEGFAFGDGSGLNTSATTKTFYQYSVDISAALTDNDGSETLSVLITGVPSTGTLTSTSYALINNGDGTWSVEIPQGTTSIADNSIILTVAEGETDFKLGIMAKATEASDITGNTYAETTATTPILITVDEHIIQQGSDDYVVSGQSEADTDITITIGNTTKTVTTDSSGNWSIGFALAELPIDKNIVATVSVSDAYGNTNQITQGLMLSTSGLHAEYFGYKEGIDGANLLSLSQVKNFIADKTADATFTATKIDYYMSGGDLGKGNNLQTFIGADASTLSNDPSDTSDAIIRFTGQVLISSGTYNFKVTGDDGYRIVLDGKVVAEYDGIQSPTTREHASFSIDSDGLHDIEILYWDQAGVAKLKVEIKEEGGQYTTLDDNVMKNSIDTISNNNMVYDENSSLIDGGTGDDTIELMSGQSIDFSQIGNVIENIEEIDLSVDGKNELKNITLQDVIDMTDDKNEIKITGTSEDKVTLSNEWSKGITEDGYTEYTATSNNDETVKLKIQTDITDVTIG
jgi:hypothetical protein